MPVESDPILATTLCGTSLQNPVLLAAGTAGHLDELGDALDLRELGGIVTKSITPEAREGNPTWRILDAKAGMLNSIGLANIGLEAFLEHVAPRAAALSSGATITRRASRTAVAACGPQVVASVAGFSIDDYVRCVGALSDWTHRGIPIVELNVSCPNVKTGAEFGSSPHAVGELVREVRSALAGAVAVPPLLVKLGPLTPDIAVVARAAITAGASGLTLCNTIPAMGVDVRTRRPRLANTTGGFSGPGMHPMVVRIVHEVYTRFAKDAGVPIVAVGGITDWDDAAEFILAGATAVQIGTATFADPRVPRRVIRGLRSWAKSQSVGSIADLVGALES